MNILITTDAYLPNINGVVTSILNLKNELTELGHEVKVLSLADSTRSYENIDATYIGSASVGKIYPGVRFTVPRENKYIKRLIEWKPDIIHT